MKLVTLERIVLSAKGAIQDRDDRAMYYVGLIHALLEEGEFALEELVEASELDPLFKRVFNTYTEKYNAIA